RAELRAALGDAFRRSSGLSVMISQSIAERAGINSTDMEALDFVLMEGPLTAGRLAELTGLTTGAITGIVDRLERAGYVRREIDLRDRRRVIVHAIPEKVEADFGHFYLPLIAIMDEIYQDFTDEELQTVLRFVSRAIDGSTRFVTSLRAEAPAGRRGRERTPT